MKIKPGIIRSAIVRPGHTQGFTFTIIIECDSMYSHLASLVNYKTAAEAKKAMRETLLTMRKDIEAFPYLDEDDADEYGENRSYSDEARDGRWE